LYLKTIRKNNKTKIKCLLLGLEIEYESSKGTPAHIYLSLGKPGDRDRLVEAMLQQQELQV
jgi:hypothetical protein